MQEPVIVETAMTPISARVGHPTASTGARTVVSLLHELGRGRDGVGPTARRGGGMSAALGLDEVGTR